LDSAREAMVRRKEGCASALGVGLADGVAQVVGVVRPAGILLFSALVQRIVLLRRAVRRG
jgi:hypothetical protein